MSLQALYTPATGTIIIIIMTVIKRHVIIIIDIDARLDLRP